MDPDAAILENRRRMRNGTGATAEREDASATAAPPARLERPVLLYSGECRFCRWAARVVVALDASERLALLPLADAEAGRLLESIPEESRLASWWLIRREGTPVAGKRGAGVVLLTEIPRTRPVGRALGALGLSFLVDTIDAFVAQRRARLSRFVPDGAAPRRYP